MASSDSCREQLEKASRQLFQQGKELEEAREYLRNILEHTEDPIFRTDGQGRILSYNQEVIRMLGYPPDQVQGQRLTAFLTEPEALEQAMGQAMAEGSKLGTDLCFRDQGGNPVHCRLSLIYRPGSGPTGDGFIAIGRDMTFWRNLEKDLVRLDRLAEIGRIASAIVHEINNPLAIINEISGYAKMVVSDAQGLGREDRDELSTAIQRISEQTKRCGKVTRQLLAFVRQSDSGKRFVDVNDLLSRIVDFLRSSELKFGDIEVVYHFAEGIRPIRSDSNLLEQIFMNLLTNAIHAVRDQGVDRGRIVLSTTELDSELVVAVADNGTGVRPEDQERIFEMFYTTKPPGKGTGLGLTITANLVQRLGGRITVDSQPGKGATFTVYLPLE
jgi:PAS domain S-box-containing protein